ncbi:D-amino-acid dehydrogenase [Microlunatus sagamiharensis]|uniref:D-amino-acid dehydrogenase n=1 Tax=Microlunatus sagamiharensis TaxID=546874 RepID=A0A1H2MNX6_9ACTN|nr:FAD-dependent oxidoreductase [Microlunatus sagamiharensis]SDU94802.1 D-amino-acid dehydrogenase [Microlunatus sagamiharensis]
MVAPKHVVVIGGGVIGLTAAYQLAVDGARVTLVDARRTGRGAAEVNAGWVCPAESAPVPGPGMISTSLKWMFRRDSPLYIRPSLDPQFVRFMLGMWRSCNAPAQQAGFEAHLRLAQSSGEAYDRYRADGLDFELRHDGLLMAFLEEHNLDHHRPLLELARRYDRDPQVLLGDDARVQEPQLTDRVHGAIYLPREDHLDPPALMRALHARLLELGVTIVEGAPISGARHGQGGLESITAGTEQVGGDAYVLAAGAWTGPISRLLGVPLPIRPGKGYSIDVEPYALRSSVNLSDAKVAVTPLSRNLRLAGTMEFAGLDEELNQVRIGAILRAPTAYFRDWAPPTGPVTPKAGIRPMTPDGIPVIGRLGDLTNTYVSSGHGMQGITLGPGSALSLSRLVLTGETSDVILPFAPQRFTRALVRRTPTRDLVSA